MVENVRASNRFKDMDSEYYATIKITPATYGYIHTNSVIAKNNATECYKVTRDVQYNTLGFIKDRFYAGLLSIYAEIFDEMKNKTYDENALTNLFALAFETSNDIPNKTISFDIVFVECSSEDDLRHSKELKYYCEKYKVAGSDKASSDNKHSAIINYGKLFKGAVKDLNLLSNLYHLKVFKIETGGMSRVNLPSGAYYRNGSEDTKNFVKQILNDDSEYHKYVIGLSLERDENE